MCPVPRPQQWQVSVHAFLFLERPHFPLLAKRWVHHAYEIDMRYKTTSETLASAVTSGFGWMHAWLRISGSSCVSCPSHCCGRGAIAFRKLGECEPLTLYNTEGFGLMFAFARQQFHIGSPWVFQGACLLRRVFSTFRIVPKVDNLLFEEARFWYSLCSSKAIGTHAKFDGGTFKIGFVPVRVCWPSRASGTPFRERNRNKVVV
mmetsp:Transcript_23222/g.41885  ORF Transcript_23222/g.41885 Transcript_23222/m.41885 type:complete len:204 (+) Transcript_23222:165-776(+)